MVNELVMLFLLTHLRRVLPDARESTLKMYARNGARLRETYLSREEDDGEDRVPMEDFRWMEDTKEVIDYVAILCPHVSSRANYFKALVPLCRAFDLSKEVRDAYSSAIHECNEVSSLEVREQRLDRREVGRWPTFGELSANLDALDALRHQRPNSKHVHLKYVLYFLYLSMKDICAFRVDIAYMCRLCTMGSPDDVDDGATNRIALDPVHKWHALLFMVNYKTSGTYGSKVIPLSSECSVMLHESFEYFPRPWLITMFHDRQSHMSQSGASTFVKNCWVLDDRPDKPTADDIRSSIVTRFFDAHPRIVDRDVFANNSCSSRQTMEMYYYKPSRDKNM